MDHKLKALKVVDLKNILAAANASAPAKATKPDLIARILASGPALAAYNKLYPPPPEDPVEADWTEDLPAETLPPSKHAEQPAQQLAPSSPPKPASAAPPPAPATQDPAPVNNAPVDTELEKRKQRAARFGIPVVESPKSAPTKAVRTKASRNGAAKPAAPAAPTLDDPDKLKARAERFGIKPSAAASEKPAAGKKRAAPAEQLDPEELERRRKRAQRFGLPTSATTK